MPATLASPWSLALPRPHAGRGAAREPATLTSRWNLVLPVSTMLRLGMFRSTGRLGFRYRCGRVSALALGLATRLVDNHDPFDSRAHGCRPDNNVLLERPRDLKSKDPTMTLSLL